MLTKIETQEIMTHKQARDKYPDKYFHFVITEKVDGWENDLGYVLYIYDEEKDMRGIPRHELKGKVIARTFGTEAEKGIQLGGIEVDGII
ncbi:MAG: hypothetical protein FWD97_10520 [Defluviitaleaceae bacterium]|nr:hypothetical protein [Defluviitaleaceae bacterium]